MKALRPVPDFCADAVRLVDFVWLAIVISFVFGAGTCSFRCCQLSCIFFDMLRVYHSRRSLWLIRPYGWVKALLRRNSSNYRAVCTQQSNDFRLKKRTRHERPLLPHSIRAEQSQSVAQVEILE
jgi:hypothetical protein